MNKLQFWMFNVTSAVLVALLLGHHFFSRYNDRVKLALTRDQAAVNNTRQAEVILDQLAKRIARGSEVDSRLTNILAKHGLNVTLEVNGRTKSYP